ncbi:nuclease-related domain-containing protein, partial [Piscibacillus halophilus]|uniref:nuclease-related domain-containing protein n=1 Tax=Piscibacillus halophilus TaxID=571933 RepID=UPI00240915FC
MERRVSPDCSVFGDIEESLRIVRIGDRGERSLDYYIELVSSNDLLVFYDLRLPRGEHHFQMDTVLVTPRFVLLVEVKNISG